MATTGALVGPARSFLSVYQRLLALQAFDQDAGDGRIMMQYMRSQLPAPIFWNVRKYPEDTIPYFAYVTQDAVFFFILGIQTQAAGRDVWTGYTDGGPRLPGSGSGFEYNPVFHDRAKVIADAYTTLVTARDMYVVAHSAGGAVGVWLPYLLGQNVGSYYQLTMFGAPKAYSWSPPIQALYAESVHIMNSDDAVPLIPPTPGTYQRVMAGLSIFQGRRLASFAEFANGVSVGLSGRLTLANTPDGNPLPPLTAIGQWMEAQAQNRQTPHSITTYIARWIAAMTLAGFPPVQPAPPPPPARDVVVPPSTVPPTPPVIPDTITLQRAITTTAQTTFNDAARQNSVPVTIPDDRLFHAVRQGHVWHVEFGGIIIAYAPHRRGARALARFGNEFIRRLQSEAQVVPEDLAGAFVAYLQAASDPASGFRPTLNVLP